MKLGKEKIEAFSKAREDEEEEVLSKRGEDEEEKLVFPRY
jgi:hypothetical protein